MASSSRARFLDSNASVFTHLCWHLCVHVTVHLFLTLIVIAVWSAGALLVEEKEEQSEAFVLRRATFGKTSVNEHLHSDVYFFKYFTSVWHHEL